MWRIDQLRRYQMGHLVVGHGNGCGVKGIGFQNISPGGKIVPVNLADDVWAGQYQQVIIALDVTGVVGKALAPVIRFVQFIALNHGAHSSVQEQYPLI